MTFDDVRPVLSGLAGGAVAVWLSQKLSRWIPATLNGKSAETLLQNNRLAIRAANVASACGIFGALALYQWGGFARNDWRPFGLGFGFAFASPLLVLPLASWLSGKPSREAMVSFAISQRAPMPLIYGLVTLGVPLFAFSVMSFF